MQTRKYPRTMQEAFGPYTDNRIAAPDRPFDREDVLVMAGCAVAAVALVVLFLVGWLA